MDTNELRELADEMLTDMYSEAEPPLDFMELRENPENAEERWFDKHHLPAERQREIFDEHIEANKSDLSKEEISALSFEVILNLGPRNTPREEDE